MIPKHCRRQCELVVVFFLLPQLIGFCRSSVLLVVFMGVSWPYLRYVHTQ